MAESTSKATSLDAEGGEAQASSTSDVADKLKGLVVRTFWRIEQFLAGIMGLEDSKYQSYVDEAEIEHRKRLQEEQDMEQGITTMDGITFKGTNNKVPRHTGSTGVR